MLSALGDIAYFETICSTWYTQYDLAVFVS